MRILIAEDEAVARKQLHSALLAMGHEVFIAFDGKKALQVYHQEQPDAIIADWIMPEMDGIELCRKIRELQSEQYPFVIIVTCNDIKKSRKVGYDAGADDFLAKPIDKLELQVRLRACERIMVLQQEEKKLHHKLFKALDESQLTNHHLKNAMVELWNTQEQLQNALQEVKQATQAKSIFLANMSHELRTPLNAIIGFSEMLTEDAQELELYDMSQDLTKIHQAGKQLLQMINDILDISRLDADKMTLKIEQFSIFALIQDIIASIQPMVQQHNNTLEVNCADALASMNADSHRVRQILSNLMSNACKFTEKGVIRLTAIRKTFNGKDWIYFQVSDTGIGMTMEQTEQIFNAFAQVDSSTTRKYGGTGLGLTITKRLCEIMNGDICVQSTLGEGSTFTVALPADIDIE